MSELVRARVSERLAKLRLGAVAERLDGWPGGRWRNQPPRDRWRGEPG
jgi:hypothetical protein